MEKLEIDNISKLLKIRNPNSHKGDFGHGLLIAGSQQKMGAAIIAAKACLRSGAGLLTVVILKEERNALFSTIPEAMLHFRAEPIDFPKYNSLAIGPGLAQDETANKLLQSVLSEVKYPIIVDADALNMIALNKDLLLQIPINSILTPHPKEFDRLFGNHSSTEERIETAIQKAKEYNCIIVLKGHETVITDGKNSFKNTTGNSGLAKGGSGDALTGIILAFLAQGYEPVNASKLAVFLHGLSADITLENQSEESMIISDVIENLGKAIKKIQSKIK